MIQDLYLDMGEERSAMMKASEFGLGGEEAQRIIIEMCRQRGAVVERVAKEEFRKQIQAAVEDKFLDNEEYESLMQVGVARFKGAENPSEVAETVLSEVLQAERAYTERKLREEVRSRLQPFVARGTAISSSDWNTITDQLLKKLARLGVNLEENDVPSILSSALAEAGLRVGRSAGGSRMVIAIAATVVVLTAAAALGLSQLWSSAPSPSEPSIGGAPVPDETPAHPQEVVAPAPPEPAPPLEPAAVTPECPVCLGECASELASWSRGWRDAAQHLRYATPYDESVCRFGKLLRSGCEPFEQLSPRGQERCVAQNAAWEYCELDVQYMTKIGEDYLHWAAERAGGLSSCEWVRRCLSVVRGHAVCTQAMQQYRCNIAESDLSNCE
ncbi:MAG: hypothetical protein ABIO70_12290 [Pseudomonadota bacterium]